MSAFKHLDLLDRARGVAIIMVLLFHTAGCVYGYNIMPWDGWFRNFLDARPSALLVFPFTLGNAGVAVFFVISGFCIHLSFEQQGRDWRGFFIRRFFRIYPAYFAALMVLVALNFYGDFAAVFKTAANVKDFLAHLTLTHNFSPATVGTLNGSFWSLAIEVQLYLIYPLLRGWISRMGWRRVLLVLAAAELVIHGVDGWLQQTSLADAPAGIIFRLLAISVLGYWFSWTLGAWLADAWMKKLPLPLANHSPLWWLTLAVLTYLVRPLDSFYFTASALATTAVISRRLAVNAPGTSKPGLVSDALKKTGLWSYSIYLLHQPLQFIYFYPLDWMIPAARGPSLVELAGAFATFLVIIPLAVLWYHCFELPGIKAGKKLLAKMGMGYKPAAPSQSVPAPRAYWLGSSLMFAALVLLLAGTFLAKDIFSLRDPAESNNLAWSLSTSADAAQRNGWRAVIYAVGACRQTQYTNTTLVGTLAAAYAEAGRFDDAISTAQKACAMAAQSGDQPLLQRNQELLNLYLKHQPYHQRQP